MKEKLLFWLLSALFVLSCICMLLISTLSKQSDMVYVSDIPNFTITSAENITYDPIEKLPTETSAPTASAININTASKEELMSLPGIGDTIAERIITYREENGSFDSIEEIMEVSGIGEKKFEAIKDFITI